MATSPHPPSVSRVLARAGHTRAVVESTSIRGWTNTYEGFSVEKAGDTVRVRHELPTSPLQRGEVESWTDRCQERCDGYSTTLQAAGYACSVRGAGCHAVVIVTARPGAR